MIMEPLTFQTITRLKSYLHFDEKSCSVEQDFFHTFKNIF